MRRPRLALLAAGLALAVAPGTLLPAAAGAAPRVPSTSAIPLAACTIESKPRRGAHGLSSPHALTRACTVPAGRRRPNASTAPGR